MDSHYDFNLESLSGGEVSASKGSNIGLKTNALNVSGIVSTDIPVINFYAGLGYVTGSTRLSMNGTYQLKEGANANNTLKDPIKMSIDLSGIKATLGLSLRLGIFMINADYNTFGGYNGFSAGINFGK